MNPPSLLGQDLDDDCFLPSSGSSLANIFGSQLTKNTTSTNDSLKYTAPKPPDVKKTKEEPRPDEEEPAQRPTGNKSSECLMAKVVHAYELINGAYETRGKLGLAILRMLSPPHTKVVLFNSSKNTLSSVVASEYLEITIQNNNYITYYDETAKNWSLLFSNSLDLSDIIEEFKKYNVKINQNNQNISSSNDVNISDVSTEKIESKDTCDQVVDSSDDAKKSKQAKLALLNRMAMMGQAILPPRQISRDGTSDSSDDNLPPKQKPPAPPRHKGIKTTSSIRKVEKAATVESSDSSQNMETVRVSSVVPISNTGVTKPTALFTYVNGQVVPILGNENTDSSLNIFLSETRMSNTEVRIQMNRVADKVDQVLGKLNSVENPQVSSTNFNMEIFQKLLREYEDKIRIKDELIQSLEEKLFAAQKIYTHDDVNAVKFAELMKTHEDLKHSIAIKNDEIEQLKQNVEQLEIKCRYLRESCDMSENLRENFIFAEKNMQLDLEAKDRKIEELNQAHNQIYEKCEKIQLENNQLTEELVVGKQKLINTSNNIDIETKIKKIMNNTFRALAANFENDASYSGSDIKSVIASVIKQTTLEAIEFTEK